MDDEKTENNEEEGGGILKTEQKNEDFTVTQKQVGGENNDNEVTELTNGNEVEKELVVKNIEDKIQLEKSINSEEKMKQSNGNKDYIEEQSNENNDHIKGQNSDNNGHIEDQCNDNNGHMEVPGNDNNDHVEELINPEKYITLAEKLTAKELISCHQNKKNVQDPSQVLGGVFSRKTINWTGASWEQDEIERRLENWSKPLSHTRVETRNSLNYGEWRPDLGKVKLNRWSGKMFEFMGTAINNSNMELWPEEALYLLECSQLDLQYGEVSMSLQRAYTTLLSGKLALERYLVYFKLLKFGYRVVRHQGDLGITAYERCIGLDKYDKVKRKIKPLKGTEMLSNKEVNGSSNDKGASVIINDDIIKLEEDTKLKVKDVVICDNSTGNKICDKINEEKQSVYELKRKADDVNFDTNGDKTVTDKDDIHPLKKRRVEESCALSINKIVENTSDPSDNIVDILEVSDSESELKTSFDNVPDAAVTRVDDIPTATTTADDDDDIVMLSSDEECQPQKSPKYKILDDEEEPDIVDLSSDEECSAPSSATGIQFPSANYNNASTSQQNSVRIDNASLIEAAISKVSTNEVRLVNENIQLLQKDLPTGFVNPGQFYCSVCKVTCNSEDTYKLHISGKKHKISRRRLPSDLQQKQFEQDQQYEQAPRVDNRSPKPSGSGSNPDLYCSACDVQSESLISLRIHLMGKRHIKMLKNLANPHASSLTDEANGIVEVGITQQPKSPKDIKKSLGLLGLKEIPVSSKNPLSNQERIRIVGSKANLMNKIPNCYGKATVDLKVMEQFVPKGCNPSKQNYTITIGKQPELNQTEDLELEKEVDENDKYKYTCRVCDLPLPDEKALIAHIRSRQHAAKLNKPELATVEDNTTITIDDYGVVKDKDRDCRGYYPKHEQEVSFKGEMTGVVYNFGYYIPLKENYRRKFASGNKYKKGQNIHPQDRQSGSKRSYIKERLMRGIPTDSIVKEDIAEEKVLNEKDTADGTENIVNKDQDVINLSSDDEMEDNSNEKFTKEDINNIKQVDGVNDSESDDENNDTIEVQENDEEFVLEDLTRGDSSFSSFDSEDSSNFDDVESHEELRQLKKSALGSLWSYEGKVGPLICPEMAEDMNTIFKRIQGAPQPRKHFRKSSSKDLEIAFDCYKSSSNYRKSINMAPDYRVVLVDPRDLVPDNSQLNKLHSLYRDRVPLLFAIVDRGTVSFITMDSLNLPTFYDDKDHNA